MRSRIRTPADLRKTQAVLIEIWLDDTDPPAGSVAAGGRPEPFSGWIDLLAVLTEVAGTLRDEERQLDSRPQPQLGQDM